jgi:hypothetical protein
MHYDQYTPDAISRAMGFESFAAIANNLPKPTLVVLLKPSFHPETCIVIGHEREHAKLVAVTLEENLWFQKFPRRIPAFQDTCALPTSLFEDLAALARAAHAAVSDPNAPERIALDGMCAHIALFGEQEFEFDAHCCIPSVGELARHLIETAWAACQEARVKNGLAQCGPYVGLKLPIKREAIRKFVTRMLVLGAEEDRRSLDKQLDAAKQNGKLK